MHWTWFYSPRNDDARRGTFFSFFGCVKTTMRRYKQRILDAEARAGGGRDLGRRRRFNAALARLRLRLRGGAPGEEGASEEHRPPHKYNEYYEDWMALNCMGNMLDTYCTIIEPIIIPPQPQDEDALKAVRDTVRDYTGRPVLIPVCYTSPYFHVAGILIRELQGQLFIEYIDSMARPPSHNESSQIQLEALLKRFQRDGLIDVKTTKDMYNGSYDDGELRWQPPQGDENHYIGTLKKQATVIDDPLIRRHMQFVGEYEGGDCQFWCALIVREMLQDNITGFEWMRRFREKLNLTGEGYNPDPLSTNFKDGAEITRYIVKQIMEYTLRCSKERLRPTPTRE